MKSWPLAVCCGLLLAMAGCRTPPGIALLEQENRDLEDRVYELADLADQYRRENEDLRQRLGTEDGGQGSIGLGLPRELTQPASGSREADVSGISIDLEPPDVQVPPAGASGKELLKRLREEDVPESPDMLPAGPNPPNEAPKWDGSADAGGTPQDLRVAPEEAIRFAASGTPAAADSSQVAAITLHEQRTGGHNLDGRAGDEGISVQIEPRDSAGQLVPAAAPVAVVVLDPSLSGEAARVARWDFTAEEVAQRCGRPPSAEGIRLEMVWPGAPPVHDRLHLFVRYVTDDGRNLQADRAIAIDLPGLQTQAPKSASRRAAPGWQGTPRRATPLPAAEPVRTARLPRPLPSPAAATPESPPDRLSSPERAHPVWSPDRP